MCEQILSVCLPGSAPLYLELGARDSPLTPWTYASCLIPIYHYGAKTALPTRAYQIAEKLAPH